MLWATVSAGGVKNRIAPLSNIKGLLMKMRFVEDPIVLETPVPKPKPGHLVLMSCWKLLLGPERMAQKGIAHPWRAPPFW